MSTLVTSGRYARDPFREFDALIRNTFGTRPAAGGRSLSIDFTPSAETVRDGDDAVVRLEIPGVDAENDVEVEVVSGRLVVRGERRDSREEDADGRHLREIRYGRFERSFGLPAHVGAQDVTAGYDAGVLSVRVVGVYAGTTPTRIRVSTPTDTPAPTAASSTSASS